MSNKRKVRQTPTRAALAGESVWPKRVVQILGVGLVVSLVAVVMFSQPEARGVPDGTQAVAIASADHVSGTIYANNEVPAGGAMDSIWQNCGFYGGQVRAENVVHSLEHGAVWVTYGAGLASDDVASLRRFVSRSEKVVVSAVPLQGAPIIASAWGRQLQIDDPSDGRLEQFVNEFTGASSAPERGGRCNGGVGQPQFHQSVPPSGGTSESSSEGGVRACEPGTRSFSGGGSISPLDVAGRLSAWLLFLSAGGTQRDDSSCHLRLGAVREPRRRTGPSLRLGIVDGRSTQTAG